MPRPKGVAKKFWWKSEADKDNADLRACFVFSANSGPQVSHIRNFQSWLHYRIKVPKWLIDQLNAPIVEFGWHTMQPFISIELLTRFAIFLIEEEERAFSYTKDIIYSVIGLAMDKNLMVPDNYFNFKKDRLLTSLKKFAAKALPSQANPLSKSFLNNLLSTRHKIIFSAWILMSVRRCSFLVIGAEDVWLTEWQGYPVVQVVIRKSRFHKTTSAIYLKCVCPVRNEDPQDLWCPVHYFETLKNLFPARGETLEFLLRRAGLSGHSPRRTLPLIIKQGLISHNQVPTNIRVKPNWSAIAGHFLWPAPKNMFDRYSRRGHTDIQVRLGCISHFTTKAPTKKQLQYHEVPRITNDPARTSRPKKIGKTGILGLKNEPHNKESSPALALAVSKAASPALALAHSKAKAQAAGRKEVAKEQRNLCKAKAKAEAINAKDAKARAKAEAKAKASALKAEALKAKDAEKERIMKEKEDAKKAKASARAIAKAKTQAKKNKKAGNSTDYRENF